LSLRRYIDMMRPLKPSFFLLTILLIAAFGCSEKDDQPIKNTSVYTIYRANYNPVSGEVKVTEIDPGVLEIKIALQNTDPAGNHPAHLHFGSVKEVGELAFALNPVDGATGISTTVLKEVQLSNGDILTYDRFREMDGSIKIHMDDDYYKNMVLAFGNIGKNKEYLFGGVAICTGH
jgi:hypothetical protein